MKQWVLQEKIQWKKFELLINTEIFPTDIILRASYNFLDKGYFFFDLNKDKNIILYFTLKDGVTDKASNIIWEFSDELLDMYLRDTLEKNNKVIREAIVTRAINWPLDMNNFVTLDTNTRPKNEIDFDKDIDEILKDIEEDPDFKIEEEEIEEILKEIEEASSQKPTVTVDPDSIWDIKDMFKKK